MRIATRGIAVLLTTAMLATTAMVPAASADSRRPQHRSHVQKDRGGDNTGLLIGLGIAAAIGVAIIASQSDSQRGQATYAPPAYYPPQPGYYPPAPPYYQGSYQQPVYTQPQSIYTPPQPVYAPQAYGRPTCTVINELPACMDQYGNWQYIR